MVKNIFSDIVAKVFLYMVQKKWYIDQIPTPTFMSPQFQFYVN